MRRISVLFALCLGLLAFVERASAEKYVMKVATVAPDNTPWSELLKYWKKEVEKRSKGRIRVKTFLGGTLGDENETVLKVKRGQIEAVGASSGSVASQVPELNVVELPYLFRSFAEADHVLDNVITKPMEKVFNDYGLVLGFWSENGFRHFGTKDKPVKTPADLKGKKMRSQENSVHLSMYRAYGSSPVPIPTTEVLTALKTGLVDGFDQSLLYAMAASWYSTIKYYTMSYHIYQPGMIIFNKAWFDKLPRDLQSVLVDSGRSMTAKGRKAIRNMNPGLVQVLKGAGVQVVDLSPAERRVFEKASMAVRSEFRKNRNNRRAAKMLDQIEKALAEYRKGK